MNNDLSSYFEDPEFKDLLAKYEGMAESHTPTYFDAEELTDIAEYYAGQGEEKKAADGQFTGAAEGSTQGSTPLSGR